MNNERLKKLEKTSKKILSDILFEETADLMNEFWIITLTEVVVSPDLSYLDIYVSSLKNGEKLTKTLAKRNYIVQHKYNSSIGIRKLPRIRYRYDESGAIWQKICKTINDIN